jgi:hypothetical protein
VVAPARAYSIASWPVDIPPQPMRGIEAGRRLRNVRKALRVRGLRGGPDKPPISV